MALDTQVRNRIEHYARRSLVVPAPSGNGMLDYNGPLNGQLTTQLQTTYQGLEQPVAQPRILDSSLISIILADGDNLPDWQENRKEVEPLHKRIPLIVAKVNSLTQPYRTIASREAHNQVERELADRAIRSAQKASSLTERLGEYQQIAAAYNALPADHPAKATNAGRQEYLNFLVDVLGRNVGYQLKCTQDKRRHNGREKTLLLEKGLEADWPQLRKAFAAHRWNSKTHRENPANRIIANPEAYQAHIAQCEQTAAQNAALAGVMAYLRETKGPFPALTESRSRTKWSKALVQTIQRMESNLTGFRNVLGNTPT